MYWAKGRCSEPSSVNYGEHFVFMWERLLLFEIRYSRNISLHRVREWRGIHVMTIHKSKGKESDEVFIYEGTHQGRLVRPNASQKDISQARLVLRVGDDKSNETYNYSESSK